MRNMSNSFAFKKIKFNIGRGQYVLARIFEEKLDKIYEFCIVFSYAVWIFSCVFILSKFWPVFLFIFCWFFIYILAAFFLYVTILVNIYIKAAADKIFYY